MLAPGVSLGKTDQKTEPAKRAAQTPAKRQRVPKLQVEIVRKYIRKQQQHHRRMVFDGEFRKLLRAHGIEFEEEHVWT